MAQSVARTIRPSISTDSNSEALHGQVITARGLVEWIHARAEHTRLTWTLCALLSFTTILLGRVIRKVRRLGLDQFDPERAAWAAEDLRNLSIYIRRTGDRARVTGIANRFPFKVFYRKLKKQSVGLSQLAQAMERIDTDWQARISEAAKEKIKVARGVALSSIEEPELIFTELDEHIQSPSEEAIRAQLYRVVLTTPQDSANQ